MAKLPPLLPVLDRSRGATQTATRRLRGCGTFGDDSLNGVIAAVLVRGPNSEGESDRSPRQALTRWTTDRELRLSSYALSRGGNGSLAGGIVSESRILPSGRWVTNSPPPSFLQNLPSPVNRGALRGFDCAGSGCSWLLHLPAAVGARGDVPLISVAHIAFPSSGFPSGH